MALSLATGVLAVTAAPYWRVDLAPDGTRVYIGKTPTPNASTVPYYSGMAGYVNALDGRPVSHRGEFFEVVTDPLVMKYAEVYWDFVPAKFPPEIAARFKGKTMAITGFENQVTRIDKATGEEFAVPCSDLYNHHWNLYITSSKAGLTESEKRSEILRHGGHGGAAAAAPGQCWQEQGMTYGHAGADHSLATLHTHATPAACCAACGGHIGCRFWTFRPGDGNGTCWLKADDAGRRQNPGFVSGGVGARPHYPPLEGPQQIPVRQVFSEGNGNEHRGSFHGVPKGYAQLLDSPASVGLLHMSINTRNPKGPNLNPREAPHPRSSHAQWNGATDGWSGLLECPCTTRIAINRTAGTINGQPYHSGCVPGGVLERQSNTICSARTYAGGMKCCGSTDILLDKDQEVPAGDDVYFHKLRIYFEEYNPKTISNAFRLYWQTEEWNGEYDIPQCAPGTPAESCVHTITSQLKAIDLLGGLTTPLDANRLNCSYYQDTWCGQVANVEATGGKFKLLNMAFHQHSPAVISGELINADTGDLICRNQGLMGSTNGQPFDENGYAYGIPPCVWGSKEEGLPEPPILDLDSNLLVIAKYNNTVPHYGVMAMWQGRAGLL